MDSPTESLPDSGPSFDWLDTKRFNRVEQAREDLRSIWSCGATADLLEMLKDRLLEQFEHLTDLDEIISNLSRFVAASRSPIGLMALFERDEAALPALLQIFSTSQTLANRLIADPESFDLMRASDGQPAQRKYLVDELMGELRNCGSSSRAAITIRKFTSREITRIAYGEFIRDMSPDHVGRQLAYVNDAVIESALDFVSTQMTEAGGQPKRIDGGIPVVSVIGLGNYGGEELGYASPLRLVFLYDKIDEKNPTHREFYEALVHAVIALICPDETVPMGIQVDLSRGPNRKESIICSVDESVRLLETMNQISQRMDYTKARVVAGSQDLGNEFLRRLDPWIYRRFMSRRDFDDVRSLRRKLERRAIEKNPDPDAESHPDDDVLRSPGGRRDVELLIQFLQLMHGGDLVDVRETNTNDAIVALEKAGCLLHDEADFLASNYARLCRLQHQLSVMFGENVSRLPQDVGMRGRLAWQLGIRSSDGKSGDVQRFGSQLSDALAVNRKMINHLTMDAPDQGEHDRSAAAIETELVLDPDPDPDLVRKTLAAHSLQFPERAMDDLNALSSETVLFLSPQRCRHFFAAIAPALLKEIATTPYPDDTLQTMVAVTDSLGAKASLWELMGAIPATMNLVVRLCSSAPYLSSILVNNPGMIDELVDSLLMNRLPSGDRLDAQSIELCRGAADIDLILHGFKNSAHLTIGVRDILGKESVASTHCALSDAAEACLRRIIEHEHELLAQQFGDPVGTNGEPAELLALALGKFGGREPNYLSDLDVIFLYTSAGETRRRVGGRRSTTSNHLFFNQLANKVVDRINFSSEYGRLYELDGQLRPTGDQGVLAVTIDDFLKRFKLGIAPLWQRLALCKARAVSGSRRLRASTDKEIREVISQTQWHSRMLGDIRDMRMRMQETASPENLKRAEGGTVDVEVIAQMLTLKHASDSPQVAQTGTLDSLEALHLAGHLDEEDALMLINNYRSLRAVEARLRLLDSPERHELPNDEKSMQHLAFLLGEPDPQMILAQCQTARQTNRRLFNKLFAD